MENSSSREAEFQFRQSSVRQRSQFLSDCFPFLASVRFFIMEKSKIATPITTLLTRANYNLWVREMNRYHQGQAEKMKKFTQNLLIVSRICIAKANRSSSGSAILLSHQFMFNLLIMILVKKYGVFWLVDHPARLAHYYQLWTTLLILTQ
ncbi:hypothetical protein CR513_34398, partial [Mucuna pruriens]